MEQVVIVDKNDRALGTMEKMQAHKQGVLHKAFSVILMNENKEILLQQRAHDKYHCGGLWSNTCCSHPKPGESLEQACKRRLKEEMGIEATVEKAFDFVYKVRLGNDIYEHEFDHVFIGKYAAPPAVNALEVAGWKYVPVEKLFRDISINHKKYTPWFKMIIEQFHQHVKY